MMITNPGKHNLKAVQEKFFPHMLYNTFRKDYANDIRDKLISKGFADFPPITKMLYNNKIIKELQEGFLGEEAVKKIIKLHGKGITPSAIANTLEGTVDITGDALDSLVRKYTKRGGYLDEAAKKVPEFELFTTKYNPKYADEKILRPKAKSGQGKKFSVREINDSWFDEGVAEGYFLNNKTGTPLKLGSIGDKQRMMSGGTRLKEIFPFLKAAPTTTQAGTKSSIALLPETGHRFPGITSIKMDDALQYTDVKIQTTAINQKIFASQKGSSLDGLINNKVDTIQQLLKNDDALDDVDIMAAVNKNVDDINKIYDEVYEMTYKSFGDKTSRDIFPKMFVEGDKLILSNPGQLLSPKSTEQFFKDYFYDVAATLNFSDDVARAKIGMTPDQMLNQFRQHAKNRFPNASTKVWEDIVDSLGKALKETNETKKIKLFDKADKLIKDAASKADKGKRLFKMGGSVRKNRENFVTPGVVGDDEEKRKEDFKNVQKDIKDLYAYYLDEALSDTIEGFAGATNITVDDVLKDTRDIINKSDRPLEFKPIKDGYKLVTESPLLKYFGRQYVEPQVSALELFEDAYNSVRKGTENDISMKEEFPAIYGVWNYLNSGVGKTPDEQTYISLVDELNRAQETGAFRLSYNIADLFANMVDLGFGTQATAKVKERYDKMIEDGRFSEPETFLGEIAAIGVEFGIPGSVVFKGVNWFRRALKATLGVNLFATPTYSLTGKALLGAKISNVAKRVGTSAAVFGGTDFIAGGPYNTVSAAFKDDPLLFDNTLGYNYEDTEGLNGKELALVNFKNRLRFGADGAIIGGLFPLVGPPLWLATKFGLLKPTAIIGGKTLQLGNELAVKPLSYLASGTLKAPFSPAGKLEVGVPGLREVSQGVAGGTKIFADFLGKDIITRAAVAAMGAKPGLIKQLPDFKDWRMFEVNSADPLKANLKKIDNVFSFFREAGKRSPDQLYLDVKTQNFIKSKSRQIEKMLDSIEVKAYNLANGFLKKYNTSKTSPAGQDYLLDQVLSYIKGQIKLSDLPKELQTMAKELSKEFDSVRNFYKDVLPDESGLKQFLTSNLKSYIRQSFGIFTNPQFKVNDNLKEKAIDFVVDRIRNNESLVQLAIKGSTENTDVAIRNFARQQVDDLLATVKTEGFDPIIQLQKIAKDNLKLDDLVIQTGEELPDVIKKLLGEEQGLRSSVMQTTSSLVTQAANLKNYDRIGELLLQQGRLFASRDEAIRAGVVNPVVVGRVPGLGLLDSSITQLYGSKEVTGMLRGSLGQLDKFMESSIYQSMIAYKAGVQTGKTVLSPATQTRNFGSAAAFVLNNGWIGGTASVADAFKITLDDIFGAGRVLNEEDLINNIARKSELGVIDENIVASELSAVLQDIKAGKVGTFGQIASIADNSKLMKTATRLYSGGDNVWKWYGHEYLKSQLKGAFKNIDEVKRIVKDDFGITEFNPKNMYEAVEEYSAMLVRELMPTYSKVPPMIQAIRKIPFIGNFVSFPAEIIRTSFATSALAMKHIASNNATLRAMGYRSLMGQAATLWALNEGARGLGYAMTDITPEQIRTYKDEFAPDYMKFSDLVPISNRDKETGTFKVFDMSRYNPYDLISSTVNNLIVRATDPKTKLDPARVETDVLSEYFNASGPLLDLLNGTLFGLSIGTEGVYEALTGKTKTGSSVWSDSDTVLEKFDKGIMHIANKNEPGVVSSAQRIYSAFAGDVSGTGQPLRVRDEMFKLFGGSTVTVDVPGSFAYKISEFQNTFKDSKVSEGWYSTKNYQNRGPGQLLREYNEMNEEAFRQQYKFYRAVKSAIDSGLMTERQVKEALKDRKIPSSTIRKILRGEFKALSWGEGGLKSRYEKIKNANPDMRFNKRDFIPSSALRRAQRKWDRIKFEDFEITDKEGGPLLPMSKEKPFVPYSKNTQDLPVPPIPDTGTPVVQQNQIAQGTGNAVNPETGLTDAQSVYLSPTEKLYYQRNKGTV